MFFPFNLQWNYNIGQIPVELTNYDQSAEGEEFSCIHFWSERDRNMSDSIILAFHKQRSKRMQENPKLLISLAVVPLSEKCVKKSRILWRKDLQSLA